MVGVAQEETEHMHNSLVYYLLLFSTVLIYSTVLLRGRDRASGDGADAQGAGTSARRIAAAASGDGTV